MGETTRLSLSGMKYLALVALVALPLGSCGPVNNTEMVKLTYSPSKKDCSGDGTARGGGDNLYCMGLAGDTEEEMGASKFLSQLPDSQRQEIREVLYEKCGKQFSTQSVTAPVTGDEVRAGSLIKVEARCPSKDNDALIEVRINQDTPAP